MGYSILKQDNVYKVVQASDSLSEYEDVERVVDSLRKVGDFILDFDSFFDGMESPYDVGWDAVEEAWKKGGYRRKAVKMLSDQLVRDFGDEALAHVKLCEDRNGDGFHFDNNEMYACLCFDKDWLIEWCLGNKGKSEYF